MGKLKAADNCLKCQRTADEVFKLELHHKIAIKDVDPDSDFDPNVQENLATLCTDCHKGFHVSYEDMDFDEWLQNVSIEVMYEKLAAYRAEKLRKKREHAMRHSRKH